MDQNFQSYQPVVGRLKSKRWVQAPNPNYEGNDWDEEYSENYNSRREPMPELPPGANQLLSVDTNSDRAGTDDQDSSVNEFVDAQEDQQPQPVIPLSTNTRAEENPEIEEKAQVELTVPTKSVSETPHEPSDVENLAESTSKLELEVHNASKESEPNDLPSSPTRESPTEKNFNTTTRPQEQVSPIIGFKSQQVDQYTTSSPFPSTAIQSEYYDDLRKSIDSLDTDSSASISTGRRSQDQISFLHENDTPLSSQRQTTQRLNSLRRESLDDSPNNRSPPMQPLTPPKESREHASSSEWETNKVGLENSNDDSSINEVATPSDPPSSGHRKQKSESEALTDELLQQLGSEDPRFSYLREPTRYFGLPGSGESNALGPGLTEEHDQSDDFMSPLGEGSREHNEDESDQIRSPIAQSGRNRYQSMILEEFGDIDDHSGHEAESPRERRNYDPSSDIASSPIAAPKSLNTRKIGGHKATRSVESLPRPVPSYDFKELMTKPNPDLRKQAFDRARIAEANYSSGLAEWISFMGAANPQVYHRTATGEGLRQAPMNYNRNFSVTNIISTTSRAGERGVEKISRAGGKSTAAAKGFFSKSRKKITGS